jgi:hemerythrin-like metal-binding protein
MNLTFNTLTENKKKIVELIDSFSQILNKSLTKNEILDFLHKVSYYTENFFIDEELFLKKYKISSYEKHVNEHRVYVEKMVYFQKKLESNETIDCRELYEYLNDWYKNHMLKNDNEIIQFIENTKK